jgi:hypothetical protein
MMHIRGRTPVAKFLVSVLIDGKIQDDNAISQSRTAYFHKLHC